MTFGAGERHPLGGRTPRMSKVEDTVSQAEIVVPEKPWLFQPGQSGNAGGRSKWQRRLAELVEARESPETVCDVLQAMRLAALDGDTKAAKVYLDAVGVEKVTAGASLIPPELLEDAPDEVLVWIRKKRGG